MTKNESWGRAMEGFDHKPSLNEWQEARATLAQPEQKPSDEWSEWRDMVVVNLIRHGNIDKDFARRMAHFYQSKTPQRKPLTDEEINKLVEDEDWYNDPQGFVRAIEAAHGIKGEA